MGVLLMLNDIYRNLVTQFYQSKMYGKADVAYFVDLGWLTDQDYTEITGDSYVTPTMP